MKSLQLCLLIFSILLHFGWSTVTFTGNAKLDFDFERIGTSLDSYDKGAYHAFDRSDTIYPDSYMASKNRTNGLDILVVHVVYDARNDTLFIGIECSGICGDADGDGNPGAMDPLSPIDGQDNPNMCSNEHMSLTIWPTVPEDVHVDASGSPDYFWPSMVVGDNYQNCIVTSGGVQQFRAYEFLGSRTECPWPIPRTDPTNPCIPDQMDRIALPFSPGDFGGYGKILSEVGKSPNTNLGGYYPPLEIPKLFNLYPNTTHPHLEFTLAQWSIYPTNHFTPGVGSYRFGLSGASGSSADTGGEDFLIAEVWTLGWDCSSFPSGNATYDECGVCGGDNSSCWDCSHVPNGHKQYDACGVCDGDNHTCWDCSHIPNGPAGYDACGVCDGDNTTCMDCSHIPNGRKRYDACGVCDGLNDTCWDCKNIPGGPARYDACGVCDGDNQTCWDCSHVPNGPKRYDSCGVCDGDNTTCMDCDHIPNGPKRYDACGVCDGDNQTCWDCDHIPNGPKRYDACGVCDGDNQTCWDCSHIPNGPKRYDACGVCDGDNQTCWDCDHIPNGPKRYDACGVCDGDNQTCWDCDHIPNGPKTYDICGVCHGDNSTCWDCFHIPLGNGTYDKYGICGGNDTADCFGNPYGNATYDGCGVCGGDGSECACIQYLGYRAPYLCYALLRWTISASRVKLTDTLKILYDIKNELPYYDYKSEQLPMVEYIDTLHHFCDNCLDNFDFAQVWFADHLAGHCVGVDCEQITLDDFTWSL